MLKRKIVMLGGGSGYFETVIGELGLAKELAGCSAVLYDVDKTRMSCWWMRPSRAAATKHSRRWPAIR